MGCKDNGFTTGIYDKQVRLPSTSVNDIQKPSSGSLGGFPFCMERAAASIDDLANNILGRYPLLDVSMSEAKGARKICPF